MDGNGYQLEMRRLFSNFERESTNSLRQIKRCFIALGRPFDEKFRQYFMNVAALRLDSCFDSVFPKQCDGNTMQATAVNDDEMASNANDSHLAVESDGAENASDNESVMSFTIDNTIDATIEISDTDDDSAGQCTEGEVMATNDAHAIDEHMESNAQLDAEESYVKHNPEIGEEIDLKDLPSVDFNSSKETHSVGNGGRKQTKRSDKMQSKREHCEYTSNLKNHQRVHGTDKPFKCEHCDYASRRKDHLIRHQRTHVRQRLIGTVRTHSGAKTESKTKIASPCEAIYLPFVASYDGSDRENGEIIAEPLTDQQQPSAPSVVKKRLNCDVGKRFKCNKCAYTAQYKCYLKRHQRTHASQKSMGVAQDSNSGLFKCTHCEQRFTKWHFVKQHLTRSHKNNKRLFNCIHCMRRFTQKSKKDRHEAHCENRRYECFLCKKYVVNHMQQHMRTHTGAKPFDCAICLKCFRHKVALRRHLDSVHNQA